MGENQSGKREANNGGPYSETLSGQKEEEGGPPRTVSESEPFPKRFLMPNWSYLFVLFTGGSPVSAFPGELYLLDYHIHHYGLVVRRITLLLVISQYAVFEHLHSLAYEYVVNSIF